MRSGTDWLQHKQNTYICEDVTQATPPIKTSRTTASQAATKTNAKGQHDCLIGRHDIRVAFSIRREAGRAVIIPPKGLAPPGVGWKSVVWDKRGEQVLGQ